MAQTAAKVVIGFTREGLPIYGSAGVYEAGQAASTAVSLYDAACALLQGAWASITSPLGLLTLTAGILLWCFIFRDKVSRFFPLITRSAALQEFAQYLATHPMPMYLTDKDGTPLPVPAPAGGH